MWYLLVPVIVVGAVAVFFTILSATARRPTNLGITNGRLLPCPTSPNCVCSQDDDPGHRIAPLTYPADETDPLNRLKTVIAAMPGAQVISAENGYLYAEFTSFIFRFVDDVEFQVDAENRVIHCRSASRSGHSDLGVNRKRIEAIRKAMVTA